MLFDGSAIRFLVCDGSSDTVATGQTMSSTRAARPIHFGRRCRHGWTLEVKGQSGTLCLTTSGPSPLRGPYSLKCRGLATQFQTRPVTVEKREGHCVDPAPIAFLVAYAWPVPRPAPRADRSHHPRHAVMDGLGRVALDPSIPVVLADDRRTYLLRHWYDVALFALPLLRPLRLLRLLALLRMLNPSATVNLAARVLVYVAGAASAGAGLGGLESLTPDDGNSRQHHDHRRHPAVSLHDRHHRRLRRPLPPEHRGLDRRRRPHGPRDRARRCRHRLCHLMDPGAGRVGAIAAAARSLTSGRSQGFPPPNLRVAAPVLPPAGEPSGAG